MTDLVKYPKTYHLPWSLGLQNDDRLLPDINCFIDKKIVVTEKMDGENTSLYQGHIHARSLDSAHHVSRSWVKAKWGEIRAYIPQGWRICGENLYAKHSIFYENLETYFMVFSIWDEHNECLSWDETEEWCLMLGLKTVPVLFRGEFDERTLKCFHESMDLEKQEGYVVRNVDSYHFSNFYENIAKFVRKGHVSTSEHWMTQPVIKNLLK